MQIEKTINVKFTDEELVEFIASRVIDLNSDETYELIASYSVLNDYTFKIVKKSEGDDSEEYN